MASAKIIEHCQSLSELEKLEKCCLSPGSFLPWIQKYLT